MANSSPSLIEPATEPYTPPPPAVLKPPTQVDPPTTVIDGKGKPSLELPDFDTAVDALEKSKGEEEQGQRAKPEPKEEPRRQEKPKEEPAKPEIKQTETKPESKEDGEELPADLMKVLPTDKPKTAQRIKQFLKTLDQKELTIAEKDKVIEQLKAQSNTKAGDDAIKKYEEELNQTKEELTRYRRRYELDNDPEIKTKFDEPVVQSEKNIATTLSKNGLGESTLKAIERAGGFAEFSRSGAVFPVLQPDPETGEQKRVQLTAGELVRSWLDRMPPADAEYIRSQMSRQFTAKDDRARFIEQETAKAKEFFAKRDQMAQQASHQTEAQQKAAMEEFSKWAEEETAKIEWMKDKEIPANATPEQKKAIEETNAFNQQLRDMVKKPKFDKDSARKMFIAAAEAEHLRHELGTTQKERDTLKAELDKARGATRTTPKSGSIMNAPRKAPAEPKKTELFNEEIFDKALAKAEGRDEGDDE